MDAQSHHHMPFDPDGPMAPLVCEHGYPSYSGACVRDVCPAAGLRTQAKMPLVVCKCGLPSISGGCEHS